MTYQSNKGVITLFRFVSPSLNEVNALFHSISSSFQEPFRKVMLRDEENKKLKDEIGKLKLDQQRYRDVFFENQRLRKILSLKEKERRYVATARIISKGWDRWANTLVIDKGKDHEITKDMAVITPAGLIGKVSLVNDHYAYVLLITDINFSASVKIQETRKEAIVSGTGSGSCVLKYIPQDESLKEGDVLVTSGFDDLFPPEIPVGLISRISKKGSGIFQHVEVTPFQEMTKLDEVVVIKR
jgi:rod shape-determining protein MreC